MNMKYSKISLASITATILFSMGSSAYAASITTLYNTGVNSAGSVLADATIGDPHYTLISVPSGSTTDIRIRTLVGGYPVPYYLGDNTLSTYIGPNNDTWVQGPAGTYTYRTTFDLTGFNPVSASIAGLWSTDDWGTNILINGVSIGAFLAPNMAVFTPFSITSGFVAGINTLDFEVLNGPGPTALRVEMKGTASAVPVPAAAWLLGSGLFGLAGVARRKAA